MRILQLLLKVANIRAATINISGVKRVVAENCSRDYFHSLPLRSKWVYVSGFFSGTLQLC